MSTSYVCYDLKGNYKGSIEGYAMNQARVFCKVMGLPEIPYSLGFYNESLYHVPGGSDSVQLPIVKDKIHSEIKTYYSTLKKYAHWNIWGLKKLSLLQLSDVQGKFKREYAHCYETEEEFEFNKRTILKLIEEYSLASYYRMSF